MKIREASSHDGKYVRELVFDILKEYNVELDLEGSDLDVMKFGISDDKQNNFVLEVDNNIVGCAILTEIKYGRVKLSKLFLKKEFRGLGLGEKLLDEIVKLSIEKGYKEIFLCTRDKYEEAVSLYTKKGWSRRDTDIKDGPNVIYFKRLEHFRPIILVHGLYGNLSDIEIRNKFEGRSVFTPDLLGYGEHYNQDMKSNTIDKQAHHIASLLSDITSGKVHIVGHSLGGAIAVRLASLYPELISSLTSIEGNFDIKDAFWSEKLSLMDIEDIKLLTASYESNVEKWLASAGVEGNIWNVGVASKWLQNQPASTLKQQSRAVVEETRMERYLDEFYNVMDRFQLHLIAGERSLASWHIPERLHNKAGTVHLMPDCGHLMMLESPSEFANVIMSNYTD